MSEYDWSYGRTPRRSFSSWPPPIRAAALVSIGLLILNVITFVSAGTAAPLSLPLLALVYLGCGALAARFSDEDDSPDNPTVVGATAGLALWVISFLANALLTLLLGAPSFGLSFLVGIPILCLCGPVELLAGAIMGSLGGFLYGLVWGSPEDHGLY